MTADLLPETDDKATRCTAAVEYALACGRWVTAKELRSVHADLDDRTIRTIAARSDGEILSGQRGYRLTKYATAAEAMHAERWLQSQGRKMIKRALDIRRARARG